MNLAESLLNALKDHGVNEIFGLPGDFALPFFKVIEESSILPLYTLSHEPAVGFAADAASRCHCGPSVAAVTYGAGALNMINPVAAAYSEKSPVVVISGGPGMSDISTGLLIHHQVKHLNSQIEIYKEVTCDQVILNDVEQAPAQIARVLANCITSSRPVYIEVPRDKVFESCEAVIPLENDQEVDQSSLDACIDEILGQIKAASSPVLMVGVEIRRYGLEQKIIELAQKLGFPVVTTFMGRGLLAGASVPLHGTYMGVAGDNNITRLVEESDALILMGVILSDTNFGISEKQIDLRKVILASDGQVSLGYHIYPDIPLSAVVDRLNQHFTTMPQSIPAPPQSGFPRGLSADNQPITPRDIATAINDMFDEHGLMPIASDVGDCLFTVLDIEHTELTAPGYYATMGFGVPAGLGIQAATSKRPIILVGDGAFQMTGWELLNCNRYGWNPIVIVFNNCSWEMLRVFQPESDFNNLSELHFAEIAHTLGGHGQRTTTRAELKSALDRAIKDTDGFQLIEVMIERGVLSDTLSRYVAAVKKVRGRQK